MNPKRVKAIIADLVLAGMSLDVCREIIEAASGTKVSRVAVREQHRDSLIGACRQLLLHVEWSEYAIVETYLLASGWSNDGYRSESHGSLRYAYLACSDGASIAACNADRSTEQDHDLLGHLLGIPDCCREFYLRRRARALSAGDDYSSLIIGSSTTKHLPWELNYFARYFGVGPISFFPCSWLCPKALNRARTNLNEVKNVSTNLLGAIEHLARSTVFLEGPDRVHLILGPGWPPERGEGVGYAPDEVLSTCVSKLGQDLRNPEVTTGWQRSGREERSGASVFNFGSRKGEHGHDHGFQLS